MPHHSDMTKAREETTSRAFVNVLVRQMARCTLPALRHDVHTLRRLGVPATTARTRWMFGFQRRFVFRLDRETLCPKLGPLAQTSQLAATVFSCCSFCGT